MLDCCIIAGKKYDCQVYVGSFIISCFALATTSDVAVVRLAEYLPIYGADLSEEDVAEMHPAGTEERTLMTIEPSSLFCGILRDLG